MILTQENGEKIYVNSAKVITMHEINGLTYIVLEKGTTFVRETLTEVLTLMLKECNTLIAKPTDVVTLNTLKMNMKADEAITITTLGKEKVHVGDFIYQRFMDVD